MGGHCGGCHGSISVVNVIDVRDVRDICDVSDVCDIYLAKVLRPAVIPGKIGFARSKREPSCQLDVPDSNARGEVRTAHECNQGWRIDWHGNIWSGQPTPGNSDVHPSAIVEGAEAPWSIFHPSPTPRPYPRPVAVAIGNPFHWNARGVPDGAILRDLFPTSIVVQIVIPRSIAAHISRGSRGRSTLVAFLTPFIKVVQSRHGDGKS